MAKSKSSSSAVASKEAAAAAEADAKAVETALQEISKMAPGVGEAVGAAFSGPLGPLAALVVVLGQVKEKLDGYNAALDKELETTGARELEAHRAAVASVQTAWSDARQAMLNYDEAVKNAGQEKDPAADRLKRIQEVSAAETAAHLKRVEELNREHVLYLKAHGASPEQISEAEEAGRRELTAITNAAANNSLSQLQTDIDLRKERQSDFRSTADAESNRVARAKIAFDQGNKDKADATDPEIVKQANEAVRAATENLEYVKYHGGTMSGPNGISYTVPGTPEQIAAAQSKLDKALEEQKRLNKQLGKLFAIGDKKASEAQDEITAGQAALKRSTESGEQNAARITEETEAVKTGKAVQAQKERDQEAENILHTQVAGKHMTLEQLAIAAGDSNAQIEKFLRDLLDQLNANKAQTEHSRNTTGGG